MRLFDIAIIPVDWDKVPTRLFDVTPYDRPVWGADIRGRNAFRKVLLAITP